MIKKTIRTLPNAVQQVAYHSLAQVAAEYTGKPPVPFKVACASSGAPAGSSGISSAGAVVPPDTDFVQDDGRIFHTNAQSLNFEPWFERTDLLPDGDYS